MVVFVKPGKEKDRRDFFFDKRSVVGAGKNFVSKVPVKSFGGDALEHLRKFIARVHAVDPKGVGTVQSAYHVEVEHGGDLAKRGRHGFDKVLGADEATFFAREGDKSQVGIPECGDLYHHLG